MLKRKIIAGLTAMEMLLSGGMPTYIWTGIVPVTAQAENQDPDDQPLEVDEEPTSQEDPSEVSTEKATEASTEKPTEKSTEAPTEVPTEKATVAPTEPPTDEHIIDSGICGEDLTWTLDDEGTLTISGTGDTRWEGCPYWSEYAELIQAVVIEEGVTGIIGGEFYQCHNLTSASLPDTLLTLGGFGDGPRLEEITIPNSVTSISTSAFYGNKLKNIVIPESVKNIGEGAFSLNPLEKIFIMNPDCNIGDNLWTFYDECGIITNTTLYGYPDSTVEAYAKKNGLPFVGLIDFDIYGEDLTWILDSTGTLTISGTGAMPDFKDPSAAPWHKYADSIQDVLIEEGITSIGARAFAGFENLTWVSIPESMTAIGDGAFSGCTSLKGFNDQHDGMRETKDAHMFILEYGVQRIGASAFSGCTNLTAVILPSNLKSIGDGAFSGCDGLKAVFFNNPECEIADSEDTIAPNALIYGKVGSSAETYAAKYDHSFAELTSCGVGFDCMIWTMDKEDTIFIYGIGGLSYLDGLPSSVRKIIISEGMTSISCVYYIDDYNNLNSIILPESLTSIYESAFSYCYHLKELTIKNPDCEISDKALQYYEGSSDFTLYGYIDSTAEAYAQKHNISFIGWVACGTFGENLTWSLDGAGTLTISGTGAMPDFADASAAPWHELAASVQRVVVEEGVTRIGENAFVDCDKLLDILILNEDCELSTEQIFTSESVTFYGYDGSINAMRYAKKHNMEFRGLIGYGSCGARAAWLLDDEGVLIISGTGDMGKLSINNKNEAVNDDYYYDEETGEYTGSGQNTGFHTVIIREGVTSIGANAFQGCGSLTSITIADSVKRIETAALSGCFGLHEIQLPDGLEEIGDSAFASCSGLTALTIPDSVTSIGASAFRGCSGLTAFTVPEHVTSLGEAVFKNCYNLTAITIPDSVASIGNAAFQGCSGLATVTLPKNLKSIGDSMFQNSGLTTITIPAGVTGIGKNAFGSCNRLQSITIPKKVAEIGQSAFADCASLTSVTIRDGVSVIAEGAFKNCSSLTSMLIPASVKSIEKDAFKGCDQVTDIVVLNPDCKIIYFPPKATIYGFLDSTAELYAIKNKLNFVEFTDWGTCGKDLIWIYSEGKLMIVGGGKMSWTEEVPWKAHVDEIQTMMIGQGVTDIAASAFADCTGLKDVTLPDSLTSIGASAFSGCAGLTEVTLPDSLTSISASAFSGCDGLTEATLPDGLTSIGTSAFSGCTGLTQIIIPESVTSIGKNAFSSCENMSFILFQNPECKIADSANTIYSGAKIYGSANSTAETYAKKYERTFVEAIYFGCADDNLIWVLDSEGTLTVSGTGELTGWIDDPRTNDPLWETMSLNNYIKRVVFEEGITGISGALFQDCDVISVTFPDTMTNIGGNAFSFLQHLTNIVIPASVKSIGKSAFSASFYTRSFTILNPECEIYDDGYTIYISYPGAIYGYLGSTAESYAKKYGRQFIPIISAGSYGKNLTWILADDGTLLISGYGEMADCASDTEAPWYKDRGSIQSILIQDGVTSIDGNAFRCCTGLKGITIPQSVIHIEEGAFGNCDQLISIVVTNPECTIGDSPDTFHENTVIRAFSGSAAEAYAKKYERMIAVFEHYSSNCCKNVTWTLDSEGLFTVSGVGAFADFYEGNGGELDIRGMIYWDSVRTCLIEQGVTKISGNSFYACPNLEKVIVSESVTTMEAGAFNECNNLKSITILNPACSISYDSVSLEYSAIIYGYRNSTAETFAIEYGLPFVPLDAPVVDPTEEPTEEPTADPTEEPTEDTTEEPTEDTTEEPTEETTEEPIVVNYCGDDLTWTLDDQGTLTISGSGAMSDYTYTTKAPWYSERTTIKKVVVENGATSIGDHAFSDCTNLTFITLPESVTSIGNSALEDCTGLLEIRIPDSVVSIGSNAFSGCEHLIDITLSNSLTSISPYMFDGCIRMSDITIPDSVTTIEEGAFSGCTGLYRINLPESLNAISRYAFKNCVHVNGITLPDGITSLGDGAFRDCSSLTTLTLPEELSDISDSLFSGCTSLTSLTVPETVTSIGMSAFNSCSGLSAIYILNPDCQIRDRATTIYEGAVIYGYAGSTAEAYAMKYDRSFETIRPALLYGDVDQDGTVDMTDLLMLNQYLAGEITLSPDQIICANVYRLGEDDASTTEAEINALDAYYLQKYVTGDQIELPYQGSGSEVIPEQTETTTETTTTTTTTETTTTTTTTETSTTETTTTTTQPTTSTSTTTTTTTTQPTTSTSTTTTTTTTQPTTSTSTTTTTTTTQPTKSTSTTTTTITTQPTTSTSTTTTTTTTTQSTTSTTAETTQTMIETTTASTEPPITDDQLFQMNRDNWSFLNSRSSFTDGYYFLTEADRAKLFEGLSPIDSWVISQKLEENTWEGSCYGMSCTAILASYEVLDPAFFDDQATSLYSLTPMSEVRSMINYYFLQQKTSNIQQMIQSYLVMSEKEKLQQLAEDLASGKPELITFYHPSGHAVVGYGLEHGTWSFEGTRYSMRVLVYDCKNASFDDSFCIYCNPDLGQWYIPAYDASSEDQNCRLALCTNDLQVIDYHSYFHTEVPEEDLLSYNFATLDCGILAETPKVQQIISYSGDINDDADDSIIPFFDFAGSAQTYNPKYSLANRETGYHMEVSQPQKLHTYLDYGDNLLIANASAGKEINYDPSGSVEIIGRGMQYTVGMIYNATALEDDWHTLTISGSGTDRVKLRKVDQGYILTTGAPLRNVNVNAENDTATAELTFTAEDYQSVLLYEVNQYTLGAAVDKNGDGIYETRIAMSDAATETLGDLNGDGTINASDAALILIAAATVGAGKASGLTEAQKTAADVNGDGTFNASDAAIVLIFAAAVGAGDTKAKITDFVH